MDDYKEFKLLLLLWLRKRRQRKERNRRSASRWWIRPILTNRLEQRAYISKLILLPNYVMMLNSSLIITE